MREGWEYKTFGEVGTFLRGKSIQKADFVEHGLPCIHYGQIHTKFGVSVNKHLSEIPEEVYNKSIIASPGDIVIAITSEDLEGSCKSTAWLGDYDVAVSSHAAVYKHNLNPKFIAYYLRSNSFYIEKEKYARGFKVMEIKPTDIARIPIPVPSEKIQSRVVSELDKINELIRLKKEQLKDYDNLAQSIFYEMFGDPVVNEKGWEVKKLGELGTIVTGSTPSTKIKEYYCSNDYCFIKPSDLPAEGYQIIVESENYISSKGYEVSRKLPKGSVLVSCIGIIGKTAILGMDACTNQQINAIIPNEYVNNKFLAYSILSQRYVLSSVANAPVVPLINKSDFSKVEIPLPPLPLQQLFAQRIELIEKQKAEVQQTIKTLETLLASRMQYLFG